MRHRIPELAGHRIESRPAGEMRFNEKDNTGVSVDRHRAKLTSS
jgi:hypothetical protein